MKKHCIACGSRRRNGIARVCRYLFVSIVGWPQALVLSQAHAQTPPATGTRQTDLFKTTMSDVLGRVVTIRRTERDPGVGGDPHRHPGSHTFGYVLEGTYEVKVNDGPLQKLGPGETFYEPPGALHAVSRNGSSSTSREVSRYLRVGSDQTGDRAGVRGRADAVLVSGVVTLFLAPFSAFRRAFRFVVLLPLLASTTHFHRVCRVLPPSTAASREILQATRGDIC